MIQFSSRVPSRARAIIFGNDILRAAERLAYAHRERAFERIEDKSPGIMAITDVEEGHYRDTGPFQFREIIKAIFRKNIGRATFFLVNSSFVLQHG